MSAATMNGSIPQEMRDRRQWVRWLYSASGDKLPCDKSGNVCDAHDPQNWSDYNDVCHFDRFAFEISPYDEFTGIDLDNCFDDAGQLREWALPIVARLDGVAYAEVSPSGNGIKFTTKAAKPKGANCVHKFGDDKQQLECYDNKRFWTVTGNVYAGNTAIGDGQAAVDWLCETYLQKKQAARKPTNSTPHSNGTPIEDRAAKYLDKIPTTVCGTGSCHNKTFSVACVLVRGFNLDSGRAFGLLKQWADLGEHEWTDTELHHKIDGADEQDGERGWLLNGKSYNGADANLSQLLTSLGVGEQTEGRSFELPTDTKPKSMPQIVTIGKLVAEFPQLRHPIIDGIIRRGDTANIIAPPKAGKSWCSYGIALSVATGLPWLGRFDCEPGRVLLIDNELFASDLAWRIPRVAKALDIQEADYCKNLDVLSLRGQLMDLVAINRLLTKVKSGEYSVVIFDAFYRGLPSGISENDNAAIAGLFNLIDQTTKHLEAAWINIHHSSKGSQAGKSITDVGAGAGSQSRAADAHLILREHQEPGFAVLDGAVRTFQPIQPVALKWEWPLWTVSLDIDPSKLAGLLTPGEKKQTAQDKEGMAKIIEVLTDNDATESEIRATAHIGRERCSRLIGLLAADDKITSVDTIRRGNRCKLYSLNDTLSTSADNVPDNQTT